MLEILRLWVSLRPCHTIAYERNLWEAYENYTNIFGNASVWVPYIWRTSSVFSVCLEYAYRINHTSEYAQNFWACLKKILPRRMPAHATVCDRAWNVYNLCLTYSYSVFQRILACECYFHTLSYAKNWMRIGVLRNWEQFQICSVFLCTLYKQNCIRKVRERICVQLGMPWNTFSHHRHRHSADLFSNYKIKLIFSTCLICSCFLSTAITCWSRLRSCHTIAYERNVWVA
jgi:hypothetical protein